MGLQDKLVLAREREARFKMEPTDSPDEPTTPQKVAERVHREPRRAKGTQKDDTRKPKKRQRLQKDAKRSPEASKKTPKMVKKNMKKRGK